MKRLFALLVVFLSLFFVSCADETAAPGVNLHHVFPQEFRNDFAQKGIDIDKCTIALDPKTHQKIHFDPVNWNNEWKNYLTNNPNATQKDLYNQAEKMLSTAGGRGDFKFYDFKTRQVSKAEVAGSTSLVCAGSGVLRFFGVIGRWVIQIFGGFKFGAMLISFLASIGVAVAGFFGIKVGHPVAVGIGFVVCIFGIFAFIGVCYLIFLLVKWILAVVIPAIIVIGGGGGIAASNS